MLRNTIITILLALVAAAMPSACQHQPREDKIAPKVFIITMVSSLSPSSLPHLSQYPTDTPPQWTPEANAWLDNFHDIPSLGTLTSTSLFTPGLSMLYPSIHCTSTREVCHATVGEGEINAAASMTALVLSPALDLSHTYFLFTGIAGVNPKLATLGGVALARYTVQVALQYELDARSLPSREQRQKARQGAEEEKGDWPSGYFAYGTDFPLEYPRITYGSEVFELSAALRERAHGWSASANLSDADGPRSYRQLYSLPTSTSLTEEGEEETQEENPYRAAVGPPRVVLCDAATSDVYYSGTLLAETFENTTSVWTNGTGAYCMTAQEDNANLEVMVRAAIEGLVDFSRIIVMRTGEFDDEYSLVRNRV